MCVCVQNQSHKRYKSRDKSSKMDLPYGVGSGGESGMHAEVDANGTRSRRKKRTYHGGPPAVHKWFVIIDKSTIEKKPKAMHAAACLLRMLLFLLFFPSFSKWTTVFIKKKYPGAWLSSPFLHPLFS